MWKELLWKAETNLKEKFVLVSQPWFACNQWIAGWRIRAPCFSASEVCPVLQQLMELFLATLECKPYRVCVRPTFTCLLFLTLLNTDVPFQKERERKKRLKTEVTQPR